MTCRPLFVFGIFSLVVALHAGDNCSVAQASDATSSADRDFAKFDAMARQGANLRVAFFGASLTWGANASDPQQTSYRAEIARRLTQTYPRAHFAFKDAAIGGTNSQLGVFRLERDVMRFEPDLVFLDFSANDDIGSPDVETLASYEALVRRIVQEKHAPVVQVIFPFQWNVAPLTLDKMPRREAHLKISEAYHTAVGDAIALAEERVKAGQTTIAKLWPIDGVHPADAGYQLFADAAWDAFQKAVREHLVCAAPQKMLYADTYMHSARAELSSAALKGPPMGWKAGEPHHVSAYYDMLMSRWLDSEAIASIPESATQPATQPIAPIRCQFQGSMVMIFGESTPQSGKYHVKIDGVDVPFKSGDGKTTSPEFDAGAFARMIGGNGHLVQVLATGLSAEKYHSLEIEPVLKSGQELRFESICVAGEKASVGALHD